MEASLNTVRGLEIVGVRRSCRDLPTGVYNGLADDRSDCLGLEPYDVTLLHMAPEPLVEVCYPLAGLWRRPESTASLFGIGSWKRRRRSGRVTPPCSTKSGRRRRFIHDALRRIMPIPVTPMLPGMAAAGRARPARARISDSTRRSSCSCSCSI